MATYRIPYWQDIPSQIKAEDDADDILLAMPPKSQARIDLMGARGIGRRRGPSRMRGA